MLSGVGGWFKNKGLILADRVGNYVVELIKSLQVWPTESNVPKRYELILIQQKLVKAFIKEVFKSFGRFYSGTGDFLSTVFNYERPLSQ